MSKPALVTMRELMPPLTARSRNLVRFGRHLSEETMDASFAGDFAFRDAGSRFSLLKSPRTAAGPAIHLFTGGTPQDLFDETRRILTSGVKQGRKFSLREGNNLPPLVPLENLRATYQACLKYGSYEKANAV